MSVLLQEREKGINKKKTEIKQARKKENSST